MPEYRLEICIDQFEVKQISSESVVFYKIELFSYISEHKWIIMKRFKDIHEYYLFLKNFYFNLPHFPKKSLIKMTNFEELNNRKKALDSFFKVVFYQNKAYSKKRRYYFQ